MKIHGTVLPCLILLFLHAQALHAAELRVRVEGLRDAQGHVLLSVCASEAAWNGSEAPIAVRKLPATGVALNVSIADLPAGRYGVQVMHDGNDNGQLDSNLVGMPTEGYGFSNNPRVMRKATFDEAAFELADPGSDITIVLN